MVSKKALKVARLYSFNDIRIEDIPVPQPGPGDALIKTRACGICSGDVMPWYIGEKAPLVPGPKKTAAEASMCEISGKKTSAKRSNKNAFYKHKGDFQWRGVKNEPYKDKGPDWSNIIRRVLIGAHGESARFHVRYFEISSKGNSSLELHRHEHVVICVKGKGTVLTVRTKHTMEFMDTVYISPGTVHQLSK